MGSCNLFVVFSVMGTVNMLLESQMFSFSFSCFPVGFLIGIHSFRRLFSAYMCKALLGGEYRGAESSPSLEKLI